MEQVQKYSSLEEGKTSSKTVSKILRMIFNIEDHETKRGKGNEFVSQMSFPFSRRTIPSSSLKQFRVIMIVMISIMSFINPLQSYIELESTFYYLFHSFLQFKIYIIYA